MESPPTLERAVSELLLKITPELERRLEEQARQRGLSASDYARELVETGLTESTEAVPPNVAAWRALSQEERRRRLKVARGSLAHLSWGVDEFLRAKHEDTEREEARWERRHGVSSARGEAP